MTESSINILRSITDQVLIIIIIIITLIETKVHITIGKIIKYRWLYIKLTNNFVTFESSPQRPYM